MNLGAPARFAVSLHCDRAPSGQADNSHMGRWTEGNAIASGQTNWHCMPSSVRYAINVNQLYSRKFRRASLRIMIGGHSAESFRKGFGEYSLEGECFGVCHRAPRRWALTTFPAILVSLIGALPVAGSACFAPSLTALRCAGRRVVSTKTLPLPSDRSFSSPE
jgi:hypothetical protein